MVNRRQKRQLEVHGFPTDLAEPLTARVERAERTLFDAIEELVESRAVLERVLDEPIDLVPVLDDLGNMLRDTAAAYPLSTAD